MLGLIALKRGRIEQAVHHLTQAATGDGGAAVACNLGTALAQAGRFAEAVSEFRRAITIAPDNADAHANLGAGLRALGRPAAAAAALTHALALAPEMADVRGNLAGALAEQGRVGEALAEYRRAVAAAPADARLHSASLLALHYDDGTDADALYAAHRTWAARHAAGLGEAPQHRNRPEPERRLRVGYVSADLRTHSVAYFIAPLLTAHDRGRVEVTCYADGVADATTARLRRTADRWRAVTELDDDGLVALIRRDRIDILVDLAGHTAGNRLAVFARRAAPVQVSYLGYPDTTGLAAIGHRITDPIADPPGAADGRHAEALVRLPGGFLCYGPAADAPLPAPPCDDAPVFGSFNALAKLSEATVALWARLLGAVPGARLVLKAAGLDEAETKAHTVARFAAAGAAPERLTFLGRTPDSADHLARYADIDVALDPVAYAGTTTTCEALWMGVPVVTLAGDRHCRRVGASLLSTAGLGDLVAADENAYVAIAARLAGDCERRTALRQGLRERLAKGPLTDAAAAARALEDAYRELWRRWCREAG